MIKDLRLRISKFEVDEEIEKQGRFFLKVNGDEIFIWHRYRYQESNEKFSIKEVIYKGLELGGDPRKLTKINGFKTIEAAKKKIKELENE